MAIRNICRYRRHALHDGSRDSYSRWDALVEGTKQHFQRARPNDHIDAEVYCIMLLCGAIIGPRVFAKSVRPDAPIEGILNRFLAEERRMLGRDGLLAGVLPVKDLPW